jgi:hypothetical protein
VTVAFDTRKFARALRDKANMTSDQAEGIAEAFSEATTEQLATKLDLAALRADLRSEIAGQGADLRSRIADQGADLRSDIAAVKAEVLLLKWMVGFVLATVVAFSSCCSATD